MDISGYQTLRRFSREDITPEGLLTIRRADGTEKLIDLAPYIDRVTAYAEENKTVLLPAEMQEYEAGDYRLHIDGVYTEGTRDGKVYLHNISGFVLMR